jgi:hypothetical protein
MQVRFNTLPTLFKVWNVNLNEKVTYCNVILRHRSLNSDYVEFCDNSSLNVKGKPNPRFLSHDNIHLKPSRVHGRQNNKQKIENRKTKTVFLLLCN